MRGFEQGREHKRPSKKPDHNWCTAAGYIAYVDGRRNTRNPKMEIDKNIPVHIKKYETHNTYKVRKDFLVRCPTCKKRLKPKAQFCIGGEITGWELPRHKTK